MSYSHDNVPKSKKLVRVKYVDDLENEFQLDIEEIDKEKLAKVLIPDSADDNESARLVTELKNMRYEKEIFLKAALQLLDLKESYESFTLTSTANLNNNTISSNKTKRHITHKQSHHNNRSSSATSSSQNHLFPLNHLKPTNYNPNNYDIIRYGVLKKASRAASINSSITWKTKYVELRHGIFTYDDIPNKDGNSTHGHNNINSSHSMSIENMSVNSGGSHSTRSIALNSDVISIHYYTNSSHHHNSSAKQLKLSGNSGNSNPPMTEFIFEMTCTDTGVKRLWMTTSISDCFEWITAIQSACVSAHGTTGDFLNNGNQSTGSYNNSGGNGVNSGGSGDNHLLSAAAAVHEGAGLVLEHPLSGEYSSYGAVAGAPMSTSNSHQKKGFHLPNMFSPGGTHRDHAHSKDPNNSSSGHFVLSDNSACSSFDEGDASGRFNDPAVKISHTITNQSNHHNNSNGGGGNNSHMSMEGAAAQYAADITRYLNLKTRVGKVTTETEYKDLVKLLIAKHVAITIPVFYIKNKTKAANFNLCVQDNSHIHATPAAVPRSQVWLDYARDVVNVNKEKVSGGVDTVIGALSRHLAVKVEELTAIDRNNNTAHGSDHSHNQTSEGIAAAQHSSNSSVGSGGNSGVAGGGAVSGNSGSGFDYASIYNEATLVSTAKDLLMLCNRTQSGGDTYYTIDSLLCANNTNTADGSQQPDKLCILTPLSCNADPLEITIDVVKCLRSTNNDNAADQADTAPLANKAAPMPMYRKNSMSVRNNNKSSANSNSGNNRDSMRVTALLHDMHINPSENQISNNTIQSPPKGNTSHNNNSSNATANTANTASHRQSGSHKTKTPPPISIEEPFDTALTTNNNTHNSHNSNMHGHDDLHTSSLSSETSSLNQHNSNMYITPDSSPLGYNTLTVQSIQQLNNSNNSKGNTLHSMMSIPMIVSPTTRGPSSDTNSEHSASNSVTSPYTSTNNIQQQPHGGGHGHNAGHHHHKHAHTQPAPSLHHTGPNNKYSSAGGAGGGNSGSGSAHNKRYSSKDDSYLTSHTHVANVHIAHPIKRGIMRRTTKGFPGGAQNIEDIIANSAAGKRLSHNGDHNRHHDVNRHRGPSPRQGPSPRPSIGSVHNSSNEKFDKTSRGKESPGGRKSPAVSSSPQFGFSASRNSSLGTANSVATEESHASQGATASGAGRRKPQLDFRDVLDQEAEEFTHKPSSTPATQQSHQHGSHPLPHLPPPPHDHSTVYSGADAHSDTTTTSTNNTNNSSNLHSNVMSGNTGGIAAVHITTQQYNNNNNNHVQFNNNQYNNQYNNEYNNTNNPINSNSNNSYASHNDHHNSSNISHANTSVSSSNAGSIQYKIPVLYPVDDHSVVSELTMDTSLNSRAAASGQYNIHNNMSHNNNNKNKFVSHSYDDAKNILDHANAQQEYRRERDDSIGGSGDYKNMASENESTTTTPVIQHKHKTKNIFKFISKKLTPHKNSTGSSGSTANPDLTSPQRRNSDTAAIVQQGSSKYFPSHLFGGNSGINTNNTFYSNSSASNTPSHYQQTLQQQREEEELLANEIAAAQNSHALSQAAASSPSAPPLGIRITVRALSKYRICTSDPQGYDDEDIWAIVTGIFTQSFYLVPQCNGRLVMSERVVTIHIESNTATDNPCSAPSATVTTD